MVQEKQTPRVRPRPAFRTVKVSRVQRLTPGLVRVTLSGDELKGFESKGPAEHVRIFFPQDGYEKPVMPEWTDDGPVMPEGQERPINRVYTPRRFDPVSQELDIDIVIHSGAGGPGSRWAESAAPGQFVTVAGPSGPYRLNPEAENFVLAGDHAGLPAIATVLAALPATAKAHCYIEVADEAEAQPLSSAATFDVTWLHAGHDATPGAALTEALAAATLPEDPRVFVACEAGAMREIRKDLLHTRGLPRDQLHTHGYWRSGEANHPDHDLGDDV